MYVFLGEEHDAERHCRRRRMKVKERVEIGMEAILEKRRERKGNE